MMRAELLGADELPLHPEQVVFHTPGVASKPRSKAH